MKNKQLQKGLGLKKTNGPKVLKTFMLVKGPNCQIKQNLIDGAILMWPVQWLRKMLLISSEFSWKFPLLGYPLENGVGRSIIGGPPSRGYERSRGGVNDLEGV